MRLIDADILLGYVNKYDRGQPIGKALRAMLEKSPTVDAVPVLNKRLWSDKYIRIYGGVIKNVCNKAQRHVQVVLGYRQEVHATTGKAVVPYD